MALMEYLKEILTGDTTQQRPADMLRGQPLPVEHLDLAHHGEATTQSEIFGQYGTEDLSPIEFLEDLRRDRG